MKKVLSVLIMLTMVLSLVSMLGLTVSAGNNVSADESLGETVLTRNADGTVTQKVIAPSADSYANNEDAFLPGTIPENSDICAVVVPPIIDSNQIERSKMTEPDEMVGQIVVFFDTNEDGYPDLSNTIAGTATLIGNDILLSCAHCVWKPQYKDLECDGWALELVFYAGKHGNAYTTSSASDTYSIPQAYVDGAVESQDESGRTIYTLNLQYDWSIIQIEDNLGSTLGYYGVRLCESSDLNAYVYTIGYPGDMEGEYQWKSEGEITGFNSNIMYYDAYLYYGNSGGAIFDSQGCICGLASFRSTNSAGAWVGSGGPRIYSGLYWAIQDAREMAEGRW